MNSFKNIKLIILLLIVAVALIEARGGRGRGGGSFGGLFGGWRKYKKPSSSGSSRRTVNGSPMHTTLTKSASPPLSSSSYSMKHSVKQSSSQPSYPRQQMPAYGHTPMGGYYTPGGPGAAHLPPGSTYYSNTAAMPQGAIFYSQPPARSGNGDFLTGMLTGHMISNMLHPRPYVSHVYHQQAPPAENQGSKIIIINNGEVLNTTDASAVNAQEKSSYVPNGSEVPLAPFNTTLTPEEMIKPGLPEHPVPIANNNDATLNAPSPPNGIICMPVMMNDTDPTDPSKTISVAKIVCFPAPPPPENSTVSPNETASEPPKENCISGLFVETDPNDPTKTIEVQKRECINSTTTPQEIFGEISEITDNQKR